MSLGTDAKLTSQRLEVKERKHIIENNQKTLESHSFDGRLF